MMSISFMGIANRVRKYILCPKYSAKKMGSVIYAARKSEALKAPGQNTWNPFVRVRMEMMKSTKYVAYGCSGVLYGNV